MASLRKRPPVQSASPSARKAAKPKAPLTVRQWANKAYYRTSRRDFAGAAEAFRGAFALEPSVLWKFREAWSWADAGERSSALQALDECAALRAGDWEQIGDKVRSFELRLRFCAKDNLPYEQYDRLWHEGLAWAKRCYEELPPDCPGREYPIWNETWLTRLRLAWSNGRTDHALEAATVLSQRHFVLPAQDRPIFAALGVPYPRRR
jgi:hypothetical protein